MRSLGLNPRERRIVFLGGALVVGTFLVVKGLLPLRRWEVAEVSRWRSVSTELAQAQTRVLGIDALAQTVEQLRARMLAASNLSLGAATPDGAGAALHGMLVGFAAEAGLRTLSVQVEIPPAQDAETVWVPVRGSVTAEGDVRGLASFIDAVEAAPELLGMIRLNVRPSDPGDGMEALAIDAIVEAVAVAPAMGAG